VVVDKVPKQPMTHTDTHTQSNQSSITIQAMTNDTLLHWGKRDLTETRTEWKATVYWQLLTSANSGRCGGSSGPGLKSRSHCPNQPVSSGEHARCPLCLPVGCEGSGSPSERQVDGGSGPVRDSAMRHRSSKDLRVHSRNLESILLPLRVKCIDGVLQVTMLRTVPAHQRLPSSIGHCFSTSCTKGRTSMLADQLLPIKDLHCAGELHAP
jgi:hypothetical protein